MRFITIVGLIVALAAPSAMAGLVRLDIDNLTFYDWDTGEPEPGGSISFFIDESVADSNALPERGRYNGAIAGGQFNNYRTGETYLFDLDTQNYLDVESVADMYTGIALRGSFKNQLGHSFLFDLWMEASFKPDDHLHTLKSAVDVWENSVVFSLLEPVNYFEGYGSTKVSFTPINNVPEPSLWALLLSGLFILGWRRFKSPI